MTLTARGETAVRTGVIVGLFGLMWLGTIVGNVATGTRDDVLVQTATGAGRGEAPAPVAASSVPQQESRPVARSVPKASRSRAPFTGLTARNGSGTLTDTTCYTWTGHRTASGKWPRVGMAASNRHPFGTRLRVQGVGVVTVEDRIGHGSSLDIYGPSEQFCRHFGRQQLRVQVIR